MSQLRARQCPVCCGPNGGKWTCDECTLLVNVHRELVRNLQAWKSHFEALEVPDVLIASDGRSHSLWDAEYFYAQRVKLPPRMKLSIELFLFDNHKEAVAATLMGLASTSPIGIYATVGLTRLLAMAHAGDFPGYRLTEGGVVREQHAIEARSS